MVMGTSFHGLCLLMALTLLSSAAGAERIATPRSLPTKSNRFLESLDRDDLPNLIRQLTDRRGRPRLKLTRIEGDAREFVSSEQVRLAYRQAWRQAATDGVRCTLI